MRTITLHMVSSLDGYIASKDDHMDWMKSADHFEAGKNLTDKDIEDFLASIDCYIMGSRTYELALDLGWVYGETPVIVLTSRDLPSIKKSVSFLEGNLHQLVKEIPAEYERIWVVGGASTATHFLQQDLVDKLVISILPILLGEGLPFFNRLQPEKQLHLLDVTAYDDGMVEITYEVIK